MLIEFRMLIKEFRITLPICTDEYQIGQLYSVAKDSLHNTGGGEGVQFVKNEPFDNLNLCDGKYKSGQYTLKIYHLHSKVPKIVRMLLPKSAMDIQEEAWNAYPYCRTIVTNPGYMKKNFTIIIESLHIGNDRGDLANVFNLPPEKLKSREIVKIDIANDKIPKSDYSEALDPGKFHSEVTRRGPLVGNWIQTNPPPIMTCYKLVYAEFKWLGLQTKVENMIIKSQLRLLTVFHRKLFCWLDDWIGMTLDDVRKYEEKIAADLKEALKSGEVKGMQEEE